MVIAIAFDNFGCLSQIYRKHGTKSTTRKNTKAGRAPLPPRPQVLFIFFFYFSNFSNCPEGPKMRYHDKCKNFIQFIQGTSSWTRAQGFWRIVGSTKHFSRQIFIFLKKILFDGKFFSLSSVVKS